MTLNPELQTGDARGRRVSADESRAVIETLYRAVVYGRNGGMSTEEVARALGRNRMAGKRLMDRVCSYSMTKSGRVIRHDAPLPIFRMKSNSVFGLRTRTWELDPRAESMPSSSTEPR